VPASREESESSTLGRSEFYFGITSEASTLRDACSRHPFIVSSSRHRHEVFSSLRRMPARWLSVGDSIFRHRTHPALSSRAIPRAAERSQAVGNSWQSANEHCIRMVETWRRDCSHCACRGGGGLLRLRHGQVVGRVKRVSALP